VKRSNRLVILVGVLLAVLAFVAIVILLNNREQAAAPDEVLETVLVARQDIAIGDSVTPALVEEQEISLEAVQTTQLSSSTAVSGQAAIFPIPAGSQVTAEALGIGGNRGLDIAGQLQPSEKAIAFQVDRVGGLDFLIQPGDVIDVVVALQLPNQLIPSDASVRPVKAVLQNKRVLYVSTNSALPTVPVDADGDGVADPEQPPQAIIEAVVIIFAGTDQDAEIVRFAQRTTTDVGDAVAGGISAVLRHTDDEAIETTTGITIRELVDDHGVIVPDLEGIQAAELETSPSPTP